MPSRPQVVDAVPAHWVAGVGAVPLATLLHVPSLPEIPHDLQVVEQAWSQQKPCAQKPESHSLGIVQAVPIDLSVHTPPLQMLGATQSVVAVAVVQVVRQAPAVVSQVYLPHGRDAAARQTPAPSQVRADNAVVEFMHAAAPHTVVVPYLRHAPAPSQVPSLPHVEAAAIGHWEATSGALPAAIGEQVPTLPAIEHDMQVPVHAMLQQTLLTQNPDAQSLFSPDEHVPPIGILPQLMATQVLPLVQSVAVVVHVVLHAPVPHMYGAQGLVVAARHTPLPSQERADDSIEPVQLAAPHDVPTA